MSGLPSPALLQDLPRLESNRDLLKFPDLVITETPTPNIWRKKGSKRKDTLPLLP